MLLIITPNPALDRTMVIPGVQLGERHRAECTLIAAGGKGLNVARAAHTLQQPALVCAPLGGLTGQFVAHLAREEKLACQWSWHSAGETRTCILVVDPDAHDATPLDEYGPSLNDDDWLTFVDTILDNATRADMVALCGSMPPGVPSDALSSLIQSLHHSGNKVIVDTSRQALHEALEAAPYGIKVNSDELSVALSMPITNNAEAATALQAVRNRGITLAIVSLGSEGAMAANDEGIYVVQPPSMKIVSSVGSGDSMMAGLLHGLLQDYPLDQALQLGVACGSADALTIGGGIIDMADVNKILSETRVQHVSPS